MADLPAPGLALAVSDVRGSTLRERLVVRMTTDFPPPPLPCYELRAAGASDIHAVLDLDRAHMKPEVDRLHPGAWDEDGALAIITENTEVKEPLAVLARELKMNCAFASHGFETPGKLKMEGKWTEFGRAYGQWGNAILTKYSIEEAKHFVIEIAEGKAKRNFLRAILRMPDGRRVSAYSVHFAPGRDEEGERRFQALLDGLKGDELATLCLGDFNIGARGKHYKALCALFTDSYAAFRTDRIGSDPYRWRDLDPGHQQAMQLFRWRIDYVFLGGEGLKTRDVGVLDPTFWFLSDHLAYFADVEIPGAGARKSDQGAE